jgi:hypothetical protein
MRLRLLVVAMSAVADTYYAFVRAFGGPAYDSHDDTATG